MRLRQIEVFHAIYSSGTMTSAAAMLNVSQPSVSKVLAHAEQQLGYALFERSKGRLIPTPEAHRLFEHVSAVYQSVDRLRQVAGNLRETGAGHIRIASTPAFGLELLPRAVATFSAQYAKVVFDIETLHLDEINTALIESRVDIGLAFDPIARPGIKARTLARGRFVVLAHRDSRFPDGRSVTIEDLRDHPFIGLNNRGPLGQLLSNYLETSAIELNVVARCETYYVAKALVAMGAGVTIADEISARSETGGRVKMLPLKPKLFFDIKTLRLASTPLSLAGNAFVEHLKACIDEFLA